MRKILIIGFVALLSLVLIYGYSDAAVTGVCSGCHTMHYSQNGTSSGWGWGTGGPYNVLLTNDCLGCHTTTGSDPYVNGYPYVKSTTGGFSKDNCLAGGFFAVTDSAGNNNDVAHSLGNTNDPAGCDDAVSGEVNTWYAGGSTNCGVGGTLGLSCAGTSGCHGNQTDLDNMTAIKGGHHSPSVYRILYVGTSGVLGTGASDYEEALISSPSSGDPHNQYNATISGPSISELCGKCHVDFHGSADTNASTPFKRHPTDVAIPSTWEIYTDFSNQNDEVAWKQHPLGFNGAVSAANSRVICLSCHRAHGTEYNDALRWDYNLMTAGNSTVTYGCLGCHNRQR